ncbi:MAG: hypothetical protein Q9170_007940 [Blastenia crenularia]
MLVAIVKNLPPEGVKNIRRTCKLLDHYSAPYLIQKVYISTQLKDREALTRISQHPLLRLGIEEIVYDATNYEECDPKSYMDFFGGGREIGLAGQSYSRFSVIRGHAIYEEAYLEQRALRQYRGPLLTRAMDDHLRPPRFEEILLNPRCLYEVAEFLPDDLVRLVRAIPRMPKITRVTLSDRRWTKHPRRYRHGSPTRPWFDRPTTFAILNQRSQGVEAVTLDPRPWAGALEDHSTRFNRDWYRGFRVITQALAMTANSNISKLAVQRDSVMSGLYWKMFESSPTEAIILGQSFRYLKIIELKLDTDISGAAASAGDLWSTRGSVRCIANALSSAVQLEHLTIKLDQGVWENHPYPRPTSFEDLMGQHHWNRLCSITFAGAVFSRNAFLDFILRHRRSLQHISLDQVLMAPEAWSPDSWSANIWEQGVQYGYDWKNFFKSLAECKPNLHSITVLTNAYHKQDERAYHACNPYAVVQLLESGGEHRPPVASCAHDLKKANANPCQYIDSWDMGSPSDAAD